MPPLTPDSATLELRRPPRIAPHSCKIKCRNTFLSHFRGSLYWKILPFCSIAFRPTLRKGVLVVVVVVVVVVSAFGAALFGVGWLLGRCA
eukprot:COSAG02_NODE_8250_length_2642_cov_1.635863_3_plen_90_part_00